MDADERRFQANKITEAIIAAAFQVSNSLGAGFLEKVQENALFHELSKRGLRVTQQHPIQICYDGIIVGDYCADLVVEDNQRLPIPFQWLLCNVRSDTA